MMRTQCLLGLRTFVAFAAKLWSFFIYLLRRQIRTVSLCGCWQWWGSLSAGLMKFWVVLGLCLGPRNGVLVRALPAGEVGHL